MRPDKKRPPLGMPVRELMHEIYEYKRIRSVLLLFVYVCFLGVFMSVVYSAANLLDSYIASDALRSQTVFPGLAADGTLRMQFQDVSSFDDLSQWLETVLWPAVYPATWYNGDRLENFEKYNFNYGSSVVLGGL